MGHGSIRTLVLGDTIPVLGVKLKRVVRILVFFKIDLSSATSTESSRRDHLNDMTEHDFRAQCSEIGVNERLIQGGMQEVETLQSTSVQQRLLSNEDSLCFRTSLNGEESEKLPKALLSRRSHSNQKTPKNFGERSW